MRNLSFSVILAVSASPVLAEDCPGFGFKADYLDTHFCDQFEDIIGPATRGMGPDETVSAPDGLAPEWWELELVREAHRVDPAKTLDLIARIRAAGGEPLN